MQELNRSMRVWVLALLAVMSTLLSGCAAPIVAPPVPEGGTEAVAAAGIGQGQVLTIRYWQAPTTLNPHQAEGNKDYDAAAVILEPLAHYDATNELVPYLAAEIPTLANGGIAPDGTSVTWKLKEGVKWSDGTDFTADDVVFNWQYCVNPETDCSTAATFDDIAAVEALDPLTVKITWAKPNGNPYQVFTGYNGFIVQKKQFESCVGKAQVNDAGCQAASLAPIGTNAWQVKEFVPGERVVYERNKNYRDAGDVYFDTVVILGGGDAASAAEAVCVKGDANYAINLQVPPAALEKLQAAGKCDLVSGGSFGVERIHVNFANPDPALGDKRSEPDQPNPVLSDVKVRQAIAKAIDRNAIANQVYGITGAATCNIIVVPANIVSPNTSCERDVEGAKALLAEAGWADSNGDGTVDKDGHEARLVFRTTVNPLRQATQEIVKQNLAEIGIGVELAAVKPTVFFSGDPGNPESVNRFYADLQMYTATPDSPDPTYFFSDYTCPEVTSVANQWQSANFSRFCDPAFDQLFEQFRAELDPARRNTLAIASNDYLIDNGVVIPLINRDTPAGKAKNLEGPTYYNFGSGMWNVNTWRRSE